MLCEQIKSLIDFFLFALQKMLIVNYLMHF